MAYKAEGLERHGRIVCVTRTQEGQHRRGEIMLYVKEWFEDDYDLIGRDQRQTTRVIR